MSGTRSYKIIISAMIANIIKDLLRFVRKICQERSAKKDLPRKICQERSAKKDLLRKICKKDRDPGVFPKIPIIFSFS
ncbi:predicted protein [Methanosarcina acetivorans C2A]|uniref:Uncharacterized protein n=1 Tax=Methanosarcina acetivorans (strain ATCC 35395 / DSM 2834 / JCM 12185 / C2A) TaxID=188937 RepID=Q8TQ89_METAC|nr:predicted protein [Methanosarcina acetivorans C2A]